MMQTQPPVILATDDKRLQHKMERLFSGNAVEMHIVDTAEGVATILMTSLVRCSDLQHYVFVDLDAKQFNGYDLARDVKEEYPAVHIIGAAFGTEPTIIQKAKIHRIDSLLQRFAMEKLLKTMAENIQQD